MTMGTQIKALRLAKSLSQEQLGSLLNPPVNRAAINKWEKGQVENIKRTHIKQMADIFNIKPSLLMCIDDDFLMNEASITSTPKITDLFEIISQLIEELESSPDTITYKNQIIDANLCNIISQTLKNNITTWDLII